MISGDIWLTVFLIFTSSTHQPACGYSTCDSYTRIMTSDMTGKERCRHRRDLEQNKAGDEAHHQQRRHDRNEDLEVIKTHRSAG